MQLSKEEEFLVPLVAGGGGSADADDVCREAPSWQQGSGTVSLAHSHEDHIFREFYLTLDSGRNV